MSTEYPTKAMAISWAPALLLRTCTNMHECSCLDVLWSKGRVCGVSLLL